MVARVKRNRAVSENFFFGRYGVHRRCPVAAVSVPGILSRKTRVNVVSFSVGLLYNYLDQNFL